MPPISRGSLWKALHAAGDRPAADLIGPHGRVALGDIFEKSMLGDGLSDLQGKSALIAGQDQLTVALALLELDGIARRVVLCPPDLSSSHLPFIVATAEVDVALSDGTIDLAELPHLTHWTMSGINRRGRTAQRPPYIQTEWILLTSGTTGRPKLVVHTLESVAGGIDASRGHSSPLVWSTFYDIRRYGGLQIFLRAMLAGASLVLSSAGETTTGMLTRAGAAGVTHISGTPSHWRKALMSSACHLIDPEYVRLSGEIADQAVLNHLRATYPLAKIAHAFASTEAGVAFAVNDGLSGFTATALQSTADVEMKVVDGSLRIRSSRTADRYLGEGSPALKDADGFVDTRDVLESRDGRYHFVGRGDGIINVGGMKVYPEEVEAVLNRHPDVEMSLVRMKKNPITGALVVADVVLKTSSQAPPSGLPDRQKDIVSFCRGILPAHKVPAAINVVSALAVAETGKLVRHHA